MTWIWEVLEVVLEVGWVETIHEEEN